MVKGTSMELWVNINGKIVPGSEAKISILDHGFLFGDSVYEVIRTYGGKPFLLEQHIERLERSAKRIDLTIPWTLEDWQREVENTLAKANSQEFYIRLIVTRGVGELSLDPSTCTLATCLILVKPFPSYPSEYYTQGVKIILARTRRNLRESLSPEIKSGNYLNNVLAFMEAKQAGAQESIMLNSQGFLTEGTTSNIFFVRKKILFTPSLRSGILDGITRRMVLEIAQQEGIPTVETMAYPEELLEAEEVFITSTTKEIMPVKQVGSKEFPSPGPITKKLRERFLQRVEEIQRERYGTL